MAKIAPLRYVHSQVFRKVGKIKQEAKPAYAVAVVSLPPAAAVPTLVGDSELAH